MNDQEVSENLSFFAMLFRVDENPQTGMWLLYGTILVLAIIVFKLGFARRLPILKALVIYLFLIFGCTFLTFLGIFLPVAEGLVVAAAILIIYKIRLHRAKKKEQSIRKKRPEHVSGLFLCLLFFLSFFLLFSFVAGS